VSSNRGKGEYRKVDEYDNRRWIGREIKSGLKGGVFARDEAKVVSRVAHGVE